jgi:hypothetical protein
MLAYGQLKVLEGSYVPIGAQVILQNGPQAPAEAPAPDMDSPEVKFANADVPANDPRINNEKALATLKKARQKHARRPVGKKLHVVQRRYQRAMRAFAWTPRVHTVVIEFVSGSH